MKSIHENTTDLGLRSFAHDIKSPLAALQMVVKTSSELTGVHQELLQNSVKRIAEITNQILNNCFQIESVELGALLLEVVLEQKLSSSEKGLIIEADISNQMDKVYGACNVVGLKRILANLIINSIESKSKDRPLSIKTKVFESNGKAVIRIMDNGCGMPSEFMEYLGQRQFSSKKDGNGLGLFCAIKTIESWGGRLEVNSTPGSGTCVEISLKRVI